MFFSFFANLLAGVTVVVPNLEEFKSVPANRFGTPQARRCDGLCWNWFPYLFPQKAWVDSRVNQ